ncbi:MAG: glycosyl transferase, group 1 [Bryobacterales bacterium]|nr:glycosyl transferase, group 1 [Bryobacterales bacterium]
MTTDTVGGVWTFTLELAQQLSKVGIEVVMAALGRAPNPQQISDAERVPDLCVLHSDFKLEWMEEPWSDVEQSGRWLLHLEREYRPDIVHLNSFGHGDLPWSAPVILTAHSCVLSWWAAVKKEPAPDAWNRYRSAVTRSLNAVNLVTSPTAAIASTLAENYGFPRSLCVVIPNGRARNQFHPGPKEPFVLSAGRLWDEAKNLAAVARVAATLPWPVYAAGEVEHPNGGTAQFDGVRMLGRLSPSELAEWYSRTAIFALPARYEPFGLSALEAGLSGCALVLGDIPSLREVWGDAALFVPPDDQKALAAAIRSLIDDSDSREEMSRRSYARALTFDPADTAKLYSTAYDSAASVRNVQCVS